jgi:hypothetical protein
MHLVLSIIPYDKPKESVAEAKGFHQIFILVDLAVAENVSTESYK